MSAFTLAEAQVQLAAWKAANTALATAQEYEIDISGTKRKLTRVNSKEILQQISFWSHIVNQKTRPRVRFGTPV